MRQREDATGLNPIIKMDFPDPDVIRVGDTWYMVSTTMHFFPGCVILRSYDLIHWETAAYVLEELDNTPGQCLEGGENIYGQGMWAASLRYYKGTFYVCFAANDTHKTYLYTAKKIEGPWERRKIEGFYHDCSLFFDENGCVYIVYGNTDIRLTQLREDLSGPQPGGLDRIIVSDRGNGFLGYEGSHMYRINGKYYVFFIHSRRDRWMRTESCFCADSLEGEFTGRDVCEDTRGYCNQGVAQGGIVDSPSGDWYAVLFQDHGAVGRLPVLLPVTFVDGFPVFGDGGKVPEVFFTENTRPGYAYAPLYASDEFEDAADAEGRIRPKEVWQFNHMPCDGLWEIAGNEYKIRTGKLCVNLTQAQNTLTQRMLYPGCRAGVTLDFSGLAEGDYAGLCALQGCYGMIAVKIENNKAWLVMGAREAEDDSLQAMEPDVSACREYEKTALSGTKIRLGLEADFENMKDTVTFFYEDESGRRQLGSSHRLYFKMDHFCGCRIGLFAYSTQRTGAVAGFSHFVYEPGERHERENTAAAKKHGQDVHRTGGDFFK